MKVVFGNFPDFSDDFAEGYDFIPISTKHYENKSKYSFMIMLLIFYPLCFGLGYSMFGYHEKFIHSFLYFCIFFLLVSIIVIPLHLLIQTIFYPCRLFNKNCYIGFNYKTLAPFTCYKGQIARWRLILGSLLPFLLMTVIPIWIVTITSANMLLYAIASVNGLISAYDLYDLLILISRVPSNSNNVIKSNNVFYLLTKKEHKALIKSEINITRNDSPPKVLMKSKGPGKKKGRKKKKRKHS